MFDREAVLRQFDQLYREQSAYYNGPGAEDSKTITILSLWPDGSLEAHRHESVASNVSHVRRQNAISEEVCAFSNTYPDGTYGDCRDYASIRRHFEQRLQKAEGEAGHGEN